MENKHKSILCNIWERLYKGKTLFNLLLEKKDVIEEQTEMPFCWERLDGKKVSRIKCSIPRLKFGDYSNYHDLMVETINKLMFIRTVFKKYI